MFGTLKDGSLEINSLALNNCFSSEMSFKKWRQTLVKMLKKNRFFFQKAQDFVYFGPYIFFQNLPACGSNTYQKMYGETSDFQCQN